MTETNDSIIETWKEASALLQKALLSLNASGTDGFEGAIAHALSEFTGLAFGVVKSGPQGGVDGLSKLASNHIHVGYEGKRYLESTKLRLDELKSKIVDAIDNHPRLDLWILATTRHLAANDIQELEDYANSQGIEALILDWTKGARPPDLAILFANTPKTLEHHFAKDDSLLKQMQGLRKDVALVSDRERLRDRLMRPSVGFDAARNAARSFLEKNLSDEAAARHTFDSDAAIAAKDVKRVRRPQSNSQLSDWWQSPDKTIAALLGGEGTGKTWAGISWWYDNLRTSDEAPLTLILPARDADSRDGPTLIARALAKAFPARNEEFWTRRVRSWSQDDACFVSFLLVFDGLDQKWMKDDWDDLFISFLTPDWRDKAKLVVSCRPDHWQSELGALSTLPQRPTEIAIGDFDDDELDELLSLHELARDDFTKSLLTLIKKPRLSRIAIKRRSELMRSGDVTPERLIYEDWKSRRPIAQRKMSHERFVMFISKLGREAQDALEEFTLSRRDLLDRIGEPDGRTPDQVRHLLGELIDSEWLEPAGNIDQFKLDADRAPAVLALTLLDDVRDASVASEIESRLAELFDPMGGSDFGVKILRHAVTFALLDGSTSRLLRIVLLERWLTSQNFSNEDFQSFWRTIGCDPELIIDFAETEWFGPEPTGRIDEVLCKGLGNSFKWPEVQGPLKARLLSWFSRYWLDPLEGEILGEVPNDDAARERRSRTQERVASALKAESADKFRLSLQEVSPVRQAWGCYRGVELLSWLPRLPLVDVYTAWALSRAIMDGHRQFDAMAWNLRWFPDDEFEGDALPAIEELKSRAQELIGSENEVGVAAGETILEALDSPRGDVGIAKNSQSDRSVASCDEDPEEWRELKPGPRFERSPLDELIFLSADLFDPEHELKQAALNRLARLTHCLSPEQIRGNARDSSDGGLSNARLKLARWAPFELARLLRKRHSEADADPNVVADSQNDVAPISEGISAVLLLLSDDALGGWARCFSSGQPISENLEAALISLRGKSSNFQIDVLARFPVDTKLPKWANLLLTSPSPEDLAFLAAALSSRTDEPRLLFWLRYLDLFADLSIPKNWEPLKALIAHPSTEVRTLAFRLIDRIEDRELADTLFRSGWRSDTAESREESAYGTLALCHSSFASTGEIANAVHPNWLGHLTKKYPEKYLDAFADHVRDELYHFLNARSRSFPRSLFHMEEGWDELIKRKSSEFSEWMAPVVRGKKSVAVFSFGFTERFPLYDCIDAFDRIEPGTKARLFADAIAPGNRSVMRSGDLYYQVTGLDGEGSDKAKRIALDEADNDQKLYDFAIGLQQHGQTEWLFDLILEEISIQIPARAARGVTLAAFLAPSERGDELFLGLLGALSGRKWLKSVRDEAHRIYMRSCHSAHWRQTFFSANTDEEAFAAFELFAESVDRRLFINDEIWRSRFRETTMARRLHWDINAERLKEQTKKASKQFEKTFLLTKPPMRNQAPKMR